MRGAAGPGPAVREARTPGRPPARRPAGEVVFGRAATDDRGAAPLPDRGRAPGVRGGRFARTAPAPAEPRALPRPGAPALVQRVPGRAPGPVWWPRDERERDEARWWARAAGWVDSRSDGGPALAAAADRREADRRAPDLAPAERSRGPQGSPQATAQAQGRARAASARGRARWRPRSRPSWWSSSWPPWWAPEARRRGGGLRRRPCGGHGRPAHPRCSRSDS